MSTDFQNNYPPEGEYHFTIRKIMRGKAAVVGIEFGNKNYCFPAWFDLDTAEGQCRLAAIGGLFPKASSLEDFLGEKIVLEVDNDGRIAAVGEVTE